jgi:hypothetical protein
MIATIMHRTQSTTFVPVTFPHGVHIRLGRAWPALGGAAARVHPLRVRFLIPFRYLR